MYESRFPAPWLILCLMIAAYIAQFSWLAVLRHDTFGTHALDLGYVTQAMWNTAHSCPFVFSTFEGARYQLDIPLAEFRRTDVLLGYHVEPLLLLISPVLLLWHDARVLLITQTIGIALGAVPAYLLARHKLKRPWSALVYPALYLLAPSLQAANLSDFHTVAFSPLFLLTAYLAAERARWKWFGLCAFLALMCKEDIALLVMMLGLYAAVCHKPLWIGLATAASAAAWFILCIAVIMPSINSLGHSPFLVRYVHLGNSASAILKNALRWHSPLFGWLTQPEILRYGLLLLGTGGGIVTFGPRGWLLAAPVIAANTLSSYGWMHSGGGHYSASIVAFMVIGAIEGTDWLSRVAFIFPLPSRERVRVRVEFRTTVIALTALVIGLATHWWIGISPVARRRNPPAITEHHRTAQRLLAEIPADATVIAQSALYPHLATRRRVMLFPSSADADFIALDVTSTWRRGAAFQPAEDNTYPSNIFRPVLYFTNAKGEIVWVYDEGTPTDIWFPTDRWAEDETIRAILPELDLSEFSGVLLGVRHADGATWNPWDHLPVIGGASRTLDEGTLVEIEGESLNAQ